MVLALKSFLVSIDPKESSKGSLLSNETEVIIAPRTRVRNTPPDKKQSVNESPSENSTLDAEDYLVLRALPADFFQACHSPDLPCQQDSGFEQVETTDTKPLSSIVAFTSLRSFLSITTTKEGCPTWSRDSKLIAPIDVTRKVPPFETKTSEERKPQNEPRLLHRSDFDKKTAEAHMPEILQAFLMPSEIVPDRDIVILEPAASTGVFVKSWDLVK